MDVNIPEKSNMGNGYATILNIDNNIINDTSHFCQ